MSDPTLLTVILNYKTPDMTIKSIAAAVAEMEGINGEIVVVDNDSQDGSFEAIQTAVADAGWNTNGRVRVIQSGHNGGFGAGNNIGIRAGLGDGSAPDYVYILNSDAFPDPGSIRRLLDTLEADPSVGFAGSYIHGDDDVPHLTSFRFPSVWSELEGAARFGPISRLLINRAVPVPIPETTRKVDWLAGASMMMRRTVLDEIGLFDETFFLYFEETDLCLRAKRAGWPTVYVRDSEVTHIGSVSTGMKTWKRMPKFWFDSRHYYFVKNHGVLYAWAATGMHVLGGLIWRLRRAIQRKPQADPDHFLRDFCGHFARSVLTSKPRDRTQYLSGTGQSAPRETP